MILNHKEAIQYLVDNLGVLTVGRADICNIHALLADGLLIDPAMAGRLRRLPAAITHSSYQPLEDSYRIEEEFGILIEKAAAIVDPFEQSFFLLAHIPYLQAFDDVNKRTSRIASNIPLLKADLAPMSFITMDDRDYIDGLIGIYELNNVSLLRDLYVDAYMTSARKGAACRSRNAGKGCPRLPGIRARGGTPRRTGWKDFRREDVLIMAAEAGIPETDRQQVADYVGQEFDGLHEGNAIRYRLRAEDLVGIHDR